MAGTWICSKNYAFDRGVPLPGAIAQFYMADTTADMTVYVDYGLTTPAGSFVISDGNGQWPVVYLDETAGFYRYRTIRPDGSVLDDLTTLAVIGPGMGPPGGGGSGVPVDATQLATTGDVKWRPTFLALNGWVRCNTKTIGSATSTGTERKAADCQALFTFIWNNFADSECPVVPARGLTSLDDWNANKTIATPDLRGRVAVGADKMGAATSAGRLTTASVAFPDDIGSTGGVEKVTLTTSQIPGHQHGLSGTVVPGGGALLVYAFSGSTGATANKISSEFAGGGLSHPNMPPFLIGTYFMKL